MKGFRRRGRLAHATLLAVLTGACMGEASPARTGPELAVSLAWAGEDSGRQLRVLVEPAASSVAGPVATSAPADPLRNALRLRADDQILRVHLTGPGAPASQLAEIGWNDGTRLQLAQLREDAAPRERLLYEAAARGAAISEEWRTYIVSGGLPAAAASQEAHWLGSGPAITLTPRHWTSDERAAFLAPATPVAPPHE
jgi:hypothetical protein